MTKDELEKEIRQRDEQVQRIMFALHLGLLAFTDDEYENQLFSIAACMYELGCRVRYEN